MQRNGAKFFPLIITIVIIALVIAAIVSIGRAIFIGDGNNTEETSNVDSTRQELLNTSSGRSVAMTVRGPIVAEEAFTTYRIKISNSERSMDVYKGYLEERTNGKTLGNNTQAYEEFVYALDKANMMKERSGASDNELDDLRGICARGYIYEYSVFSADNEVEKRWTSTCDGSKGTLNASTDQLSGLFLAQIPDSNELVPFRQANPFRL